MLCDELLYLYFGEDLKSLSDVTFHFVAIVAVIHKSYLIELDVTIFHVSAKL